MRRDVDQFVGDMLNAAELSISFSRGRSRTDLDRDLMFRYALVKALEIIGEAASQIPEIVKDQYPLIRWRAISSMRNRLVHSYYDINYDIVWDAVNVDVPVLIELLSPLTDSP